MVQVIMKPEIFKYATCKEFAEGFALGAEDLVLNQQIYLRALLWPLGPKSPYHLPGRVWYGGTH